MGAVSAIIQGAFREANLIPLGATATDEEVAEALPRLNNLLASLFGFELGVKLMDFEVPKDLPTPHEHPHGHHDSHRKHHCPTDVRIVSRVGGNTTVELIERPQDGARLAFVDVGMSGTLTIDAAGRLIEGASSIAIEPATGSLEWFYRADLGNWLQLGPLQDTDSSPLPDEFDEFLITSLAVRLMAREGNEPRTGTVDSLRRMTTRLKSRYTQDVPESLDHSFHGGASGPHDLFGRF